MLPILPRINKRKPKGNGMKRDTAKLGDAAKIKHKFSGFRHFAMACMLAGGGHVTPAMKHWQRTCDLLGMIDVRVRG